MELTCARAIMNAYLLGLAEGLYKFGPLVISSERKMTTPDGWPFYWNTHSFVVDGQRDKQLLGPGPVIVLADGHVFPGGSGDATFGDGLERILKRHGVDVDHVILQEKQ